MEQLEIRQGHNPDSNPIPGLGIDSQGGFGHSFQLFPCGCRGDRAVHPPGSSSECRAWEKTAKQQQPAPEKLPAKISQGQTQCSGQSETKVVFSGHFTLFFLSFLLMKRKEMKCEVNPVNFVIWGFTSREISPFSVQACTRKFPLYLTEYSLVFP